MITLAMAAAHGSLVGAQRRWPNQLHAVTIGNALTGWPKARTIEAACGRRVAIIYPFIWWAPAVRGTPMTRCPECEEQCGKRTRRPPKWMTAQQESP